MLTMFLLYVFLHINNDVAKKAGVAILLTVREIMISENLDIVTGDLNSAAWDYKGSNFIRDVCGLLGHGPLQESGKTSAGPSRPQEHSNSGSSADVEFVILIVEAWAF